jgi:hypothetical protein
MNIQIRELTQREQDAVRAFMKNGGEIPALIAMLIAMEIKKVDSIGALNTECSDIDLGNEARAARKAHDTLLNIFDAIGFGVLGDFIHQPDTKKQSYR